MPSLQVVHDKNGTTILIKPFNKTGDRTYTLQAIDRIDGKKFRLQITDCFAPGDARKLANKLDYEVLHID